MIGRVWAFLFLYGASALTGLFLAVFWTRFAISRCRNVSHPCRKDRVFVLSSSIALVSAGMVLIDGARAVGNAEFGLSSILQRDEAYFIAAGLFLAILGFLKMTWLADLEKHPPKWSWLRAMIGVTLLWAVIAFLIAPGVPFAHG